MSRIRIMDVALALSAFAFGCGSPTEPPANLLIGRWLAFDLQVNGIDRHLSGPGANGLGQLDFNNDGTATVWFWFDGHLAVIPWPHEWTTDRGRLFIGADLEVRSDYSPSFSINKDILVLTFEEPQQNGVRREVWKYSRITP